MQNLANALGAIADLLSSQLLVGFALGYIAKDFGHVAWTKGLSTWRTTFQLAALAARYGLVAAVLGTVLYFV